MLADEVRGKSKWRYVYTVFPILSLGENFVGRALYRRYRKRSERLFRVMSREIIYDLDYLDRTDTLKLTLRQRRQLAPLVERLRQVDLAQGCVFNEIYSVLTPQQYSAILNRDAPRVQ